MIMANFVSSLHFTLRFLLPSTYALSHSTLSMSHVFVPTVSEGFNRSIEQAWERTLAVAQNHVQAFDDQGRQPTQDTQSSRNSSEFYDRERHMMQALDVLFGYAHEGKATRIFELRYLSALSL